MQPVLKATAQRVGMSMMTKKGANWSAGEEEDWR
jgi:hypothetical protein